MTTKSKEGTLQELSARLFEQMDAVTNPDLEGEQLKAELERTKCVIELGKTIISTADVMVRARVAWDNKVVGDYEPPKLIS